MFKISAFLDDEAADKRVAAAFWDVFEVRRVPKKGDLVRLHSLKAIGYDVLFSVSDVIWSLDPKNSGHDAEVRLTLGTSR